MGNAAYICTMFINKSRNKSGTTSVRVLEKRGRNNVLVKSHTKPSKVILRMDDEQTELVNIVSNWVNRDFG